MEEINMARGKAAFTLKERLQHAKVSNPTHAIVTSYEMEAEVDDMEEHNEWFKIVGKMSRCSMCLTLLLLELWTTPWILMQILRCHAHPRSRTLGTQRSRHSLGDGTHTMSRPWCVHVASFLHGPLCMVPRWSQTFWYSHLSSSPLMYAHPALKVMVKNAFSVPGAQKPEHLIYDSNCDAKQQVMASQDPYFQDMGMCVDVWHFLNKHKVTHHFCQENCNPAMYPEL
jgi:hypothetical protein